MTYQRETDEKIAGIHDRLDKLEDISSDIATIKEWMETCTKVFRGMEILGCFIGKWAVRFGKIGAGIAIGWASFKYGMQGVWDVIRGYR